jgi:hypothetical protein
MTVWDERSQVSAAYLNPAFIAAVLAGAANGYQEDRDRHMVWPLAFVVAPLVLHRSTRETLPRNTTTHLSAWISRNPLLHAGFAQRAQELVPTVREGLRFGLRHGLLTLEAGHLGGALKTTRDRQLRTLLARARRVGHWLSRTDQPATVFALFGVEP